MSQLLKSNFSLLGVALEPSGNLLVLHFEQRLWHLVGKNFSPQGGASL